MKLWPSPVLTPQLTSPLPHSRTNTLWRLVSSPRAKRWLLQAQAGLERRRNAQRSLVTGMSAECRSQVDRCVTAPKMECDGEIVSDARHKLIWIWIRFQTTDECSRLNLMFRVVRTLIYRIWIQSRYAKNPMWAASLNMKTHVSHRGS